MAKATKASTKKRSPQKASAKRATASSKRASAKKPTKSSARASSTRKTASKSAAKRSTARKPTVKKTAKKTAKKAVKKAVKKAARKAVKRVAKKVTKTTAKKAVARKPAKKTTAKKSVARKSAKKTTGRTRSASRPAAAPSWNSVAELAADSAAPPVPVAAEQKQAPKKFQRRYKTWLKRLIGLRRRLLGETTQLEEEALKASEGDVSIDHMADYGSDAYEQEFTLSLIESKSEALRDVDEAIRKIEVGSYGLCEECETLIPSGRLEVVPHTRLCIECKSAQESASGF